MYRAYSVLAGSFPIYSSKGEPIRFFPLLRDSLARAVSSRPAFPGHPTPVRHFRAIRTSNGRLRLWGPGRSRRHGGAKRRIFWQRPGTSPDNKRSAGSRSVHPWPAATLCGRSGIHCLSLWRRTVQQTRPYCGRKKGIDQFYQQAVGVDLPRSEKKVGRYLGPAREGPLASSENALTAAGVLYALEADEGGLGTVARFRNQGLAGVSAGRTIRGPGPGKSLETGGGPGRTEPGGPDCRA